MIEKLKQLDHSKLPAIWCCLNGWDFPPELIEFKPSHWDLLPPQAKRPYIRESIDYIKGIIPEKELLREWNKERLPGAGFDVWWENREPLSELDIKLLEEIHNIKKASTQN